MKTDSKRRIGYATLSACIALALSLSITLQPTVAQTPPKKVDPCKLVSEATLKKLTGVTLKRGKGQPLRDPVNGTAQCSYGATGKTSTQLVMITVMPAQEFRRFNAAWAAQASADKSCTFSLNLSVSVGRNGIKVPTPTPLPPSIQAFADKPWPDFFATYLKAEDVCDSYYEPIPNTDGVVVAGLMRGFFILGASAMLPKGDQVLQVMYADIPNEGYAPSTASKSATPAPTSSPAQNKESMKQYTTVWRENAVKIARVALAGL